jgi:hypothetical protein
MTLEWPRQPFRLLGVAMAISLVLAFPVEQVVHTNYREFAARLLNLT